MLVKMNIKQHTFVVEINGRYFYKYSNGRCLTAWSLAGAKHFQPLDIDRCKAICKAETEKGKDCWILTCGLVDYPEYNPETYNDLPA